jgi:formiminotetrahydrofolate cyclodeaminase
VLPEIEAVAARGNENSLSDAGVAALALSAAASGAMLNVLINLPGLSDAAYAEKARAKAEAMCDEVDRRSDAVYRQVLKRLRQA